MDESVDDEYLRSHPVPESLGHRTEMPVQRLQEEAEAVAYPTPQQFLDYVRNRKMVNFRKLEDPKVRPSCYPAPCPWCYPAQVYQPHAAIICSRPFMIKQGG